VWPEATGEVPLQGVASDLLEAIVMSKRDILLVKQGLCRLYHSWPHFIIKPVWYQQKYSSGAGEENYSAAAAAAAPWSPAGVQDVLPGSS